MKKYNKLELFINQKLNEYKNNIQSKNDVIYNKILESTGYNSVLKKIYSLEIKKCILEYEIEKSSLKKKDNELIKKHHECENDINNLKIILDEKKKISDVKYKKLYKRINPNILNTIKQNAIDEYDSKRKLNLNSIQKKRY